jgi:hypothetical protein
MEKVLNDLHVKLYEELSQYCQNGIKTHEDADVVNDLLASIKNIYKIKMYMDEEHQSEQGYSGMPMYRNMNGNSNARMMYDRGNSYNYDADYSYGMPYYEAPRRVEKSWLLTPQWGNSYNSDMSNYKTNHNGTSKEDMIEQLKQMMEQAEALQVKQAISDCITTLNK